MLLLVYGFLGCLSITASCLHTYFSVYEINDTRKYAKTILPTTYAVFTTVKVELIEITTKMERC